MRSLSDSVRKFVFNFPFPLIVLWSWRDSTCTVPAGGGGEGRVGRGVRVFQAELGITYTSLYPPTPLRVPYSILPQDTPKFNHILYIRLAKSYPTFLSDQEVMKEKGVHASELDYMFVCMCVIEAEVRKQG